MKKKTNADVRRGKRGHQDKADTQGKVWGGEKCLQGDEIADRSANCHWLNHQIRAKQSRVIKQFCISHSCNTQDTKEWGCFSNWIQVNAVLLVMFRLFNAFYKDKWKKKWWVRATIKCVRKLPRGVCSTAIELDTFTARHWLGCLFASMNQLYPS